MTITKTLQATFAPPTAHKQSKLNDLLETYRDSLQEAFDAGATREAAAIHAELLASGTRINVADIMIAGVCRHHGADLVTRDGDFEAVDGLETLSY
ncbi:PIN domain-containing protein [Natrinema sp. 1APR25-10V2]|uniref:PIN domain-containing protein n=1 Tax=Natrinema sp. 1APR25-10V2 TaxID=2951081 RepID=UPI0028763162|nr:PIN domain-containing protein [Natrinema sp. 1APR25-10V2]MDS0475763.1 PIN domain-containing protein [Natrinema sp. 1APR25-10V2]